MTLSKKQRLAKYKCICCKEIRVTTNSEGFCFLCLMDIKKTAQNTKPTKLNELDDLVLDYRNRLIEEAKNSIIDLNKVEATLKLMKLSPMEYLQKYSF